MLETPNHYYIVNEYEHDEENDETNKIGTHVFGQTEHSKAWDFIESYTRKDNGKCYTFTSLGPVLMFGSPPV